MKYVVAIIRPEKLDAVRDELTAIGVDGMTLSEVKGFGRQKGHSEIYRGAEYKVDFTLKIKIEIALDESLAPRVVEKIRDAAMSDRIGAGKIFVFDLEEVVRVRTGEMGAAAL